MTRLGDFWKFLVPKFVAKGAQKVDNFLGNFVTPLSYVKLSWLLFGHFWEHLGYFLLQHLVTLGVGHRIHTFECAAFTFRDHQTSNSMRGTALPNLTECEIQFFRVAKPGSIRWQFYASIHRHKKLDVSFRNEEEKECLYTKWVHHLVIISMMSMYDTSYDVWAKGVLDVYLLMIN